MLIRSSSLFLLFPFFSFPFLPRLEHFLYLATRVPGSPADPGCPARPGSSLVPGRASGSAGYPGKPYPVPTPDSNFQPPGASNNALVVVSVLPQTTFTPPRNEEVMLLGPVVRFWVFTPLRFAKADERRDFSDER